MSLPNEKKESQFIEERDRLFNHYFNCIDVNEADYDHEGIPDNKVVIDIQGMSKVGLEEVREFHRQSLELQRQKFIEGIEKHNYKRSHFCGFNDGSCDCDCYLAGKAKSIKIIKSI